MISLESRSPFRLYGRRKGRPLKSDVKDLMTTLLPHVLFKKEYTFYSDHKYALEIGFGRGEHLVHKAQHLSDFWFIGCEAFQNGIAHLLKEIDEKSLKNISIYPHDVRYLLEMLPDSCLDCVFILFPDPWPKAKHHKRRLVNDLFFQQLLRILKPTGQFYFASDHESYVFTVLELIKKNQIFKEITFTQDKPEDWPWTRYNQKAYQTGRISYYIQAFL